MIRVKQIAILAALVPVFALAAESWPQFRGPNSSGVGDGKPPAQFGPDRSVLWKTPVGRGLSSPVVWGGRIFLTEVDQANKRLTTMCIDRRSGSVLWRRSVTAAFTATFRSSVAT